mmetsp:Transcript_39555/g.51821  ORF Transcript_39555/g.51821 Transcript_39555/m.51821 type:complete len:194 (-) Transcript_39555:217-798(-)
MLKNVTASSGLNPTVQFDVKEETAEVAVTAFASLATGVTQIPALTAGTALCTALTQSYTGGAKTSALYSGTGAVTAKLTDTATSGYSCVLDAAATERTTTKIKITSYVTVTSTEAKITAWETLLNNEGHKSMGSVTLKDNTVYGYFGRSDMMYVNKSSVSTVTSLGAATTALTGGLSLGVMASALSLATLLAF